MNLLNGSNGTIYFKNAHLIDGTGREPILGGVVVEGDKIKRVGVIEPERRVTLLAGRAGPDAPQTGPVVCACFGIGRDMIAAAIASGKAVTAASIGDLLKAGTNCGSCLPEIRALIAGSRAEAAV